MVGRERAQGLRMAWGRPDACTERACGLTHSGAALTHMYSGALRGLEEICPLPGPCDVAFYYRDALVCLT